MLVAGGGGFIGSHLVEALVSSGHEVTVADDFSSGDRRNLRHLEGRIELRELDVADESIVGEFDVVYNLASNAARADWERHPVRIAITNAVGSRRLIETALHNGARYVYASSSEIYGTPTQIPTPESDLGQVSTVGPRSSYDEGKRFGEALMKAFEREHGLDGVIVRIFNTYGPRMRQGEYGRVIERFLAQGRANRPLTIYGSGTQTRSFCYVDDIVKGLLTCARAGMRGEVYNLGGSEEVTIEDLARLVCRLLGREATFERYPLPLGDPVRRAADSRKVRRLGWEPRVSLEVGIQAMIRGDPLTRVG